LGGVFEGGPQLSNLFFQARDQQIRSPRRRHQDLRGRRSELGHGSQNIRRQQCNGSYFFNVPNLRLFTPSGSRHRRETYNTLPPPPPPFQALKTTWSFQRWNMLPPD